MGPEPHREHHALRTLARAWGVRTSYVDLQGTRQYARPEALAEVLRVLGVPLARIEDADEAVRQRHQELWQGMAPPVVVAWRRRGALVPLRFPAPAAGPLACELTLETGERRRWTASVDEAPVVRRETVEGVDYVERHLTLAPDMPIGYHRLTVEAAGRSAGTEVFCAPRRAWRRRHAGPSWGVFLPLHALRTADDWGVGDLGDLGELGAWAAERGAGTLGTLPLLATFLDEPFEPSPYAPVSRLFWNELFLDAEALPEVQQSPEARAVLASDAFRAEADALRREGLVDYARAAALKRRVVELASRSLFERGGARLAALERFVSERPDAESYARFRGAVEARKASWFTWPEAMQRGRIEEGEWDEAARRYHLYAQFALHEQLTALDTRTRARGLDLYLDLPIGVHPDGYDVWREQASFALGVSAGAPPDALFTEGQDWGFPPMHPSNGRESGHRYWIACIRNHLRYAGRLRVDHVMGLYRLYWVPRGFGAREGVYVRYPEEELFAVLCIESHRAQAEVVGENLGTVPVEVEKAMRRHRIQGMYVGQFAVDTDATRDVRPPAPTDLAALNTHDLPTFGGWWHGDDIEQRVELGFLDRPTADHEHHVRGLQRQGLIAFLQRQGLPGGDAEASLEGDLRWLAARDAHVLLVNLEDLWLERAPQNVPGTHREVPNWRRKARYTLEQIETLPRVGQVLAEVDRARRSKSR